MQAEGVEQGIGDLGESGGAADADDVLAGEFEDLGQKLADLVDFGDFAEFGSEFGEGSGGGGARADVKSAKEVTE